MKYTMTNSSLFTNIINKIYLKGITKISISWPELTRLKLSLFAAAGKGVEGEDKTGHYMGTQVTTLLPPLDSYWTLYGFPLFYANKKRRYFFLFICLILS